MSAIPTQMIHGRAAVSPGSMSAIPSQLLRGTAAVSPGHYSCRVPCPGDERRGRAMRVYRQCSEDHVPLAAETGTAGSVGSDNLGTWGGVTFGRGEG